MSFFQFSVNGGTYNRVGGIGYVAESASNRKASLVFVTDNGSARAERVRITGDGNVGIGTDAPQGKLHVYDGSAGKGLFTKTNVGASAQTIIPNGTGDVARGVAGSAILYDGTTTVIASTLALRQGGTTTYDMVGASSTWRTTLNADGSLTVARISGSSTATISYHLHWM
jgi:hypothetical protein